VRQTAVQGILTGLVLLASCGRQRACPRCDTLIIAATGEPQALLPPLVGETVGRDISDQIYERLADLAPGAASIDTSAFRSRLAERWERVDSVTLRFHLRPAARWQDGTPVTAGDVVFSFQAFSDSVIDAPARASLAGQVTASAEDSSTVLVHFTHRYPEQLYDATWHVRVIPAHIWRWIPQDGWGADTASSRLVGSGPYRLLRWDRGQSITLVADTAAGRRPRTGTVIWRFAADPDAALNLVLSGGADLMESIGSPERVARVEADSALQALRYPSAAYGYLAFQLDSRRGGGASALTDRTVRRALAMAVDRPGVARLVFGAGAKAPPGPMSQLLWIWNDSISAPGYDTAGASRALDQAGWRRGSDGVRRKGGRALGFDVLVPSTSLARKRLAEAVQEQWRKAGVAVTVTAVDFPVFMARLGKGEFDSYVASYLDEPSPRGLADQWTTPGIGALNYGRYASPAFDRSFGRALAARDLAAARPLWRAAMDSLNLDVPALFLYAPVNVAAVARRVQGFAIDPYSWLSGLAAVSLRPE
jgi:peptide/nickel transport system substrate-binding protein